MYFIPGILSILFMTTVLVYQSVYTYVIIAWKKNEALELMLTFLEKDYFIEILIIAIILLLLYIFLTPVFEWALIKYIQRRDAEWYDKKISWSDVLWIGILKFLPVFEYDQMFNKFKLLSILNFYLFTIRFIWIEYLKYVSYIYIIIFWVSIFANMFFSYSKFEIVIGNKKVFPSVTESAKIAILNLKITARLYLLIMVLNFRVIFNFFILLLFPFLISFAIWYITSQMFLWITITFLVITFVLLIAFISYLSAVLEVFTTSLWFYAWKRCKKNAQKIDN
jgi:hypothetical protein